MCFRDKSRLYADDTVLVFVGVSLEELIDHVNVRLHITLDWCKCNKLSLNPTKPEFMVVTNKRFIARPQLPIGSDLNEEVSSSK